MAQVLHTVLKKSDAVSAVKLDRVGGPCLIWHCDDTLQYTVTQLNLRRRARQILLAGAGKILQVLEIGGDGQVNKDCASYLALEIWATERKNQVGVVGSLYKICKSGGPDQPKDFFLKFAPRAYIVCNTSNHSA